MMDSDLVEPTSSANAVAVNSAGFVPNAVGQLLSLNSEDISKTTRQKPYKLSWISQSTLTVVYPVFHENPAKH